MGILRPDLHTLGAGLEQAPKQQQKTELKESPVDCRDCRHFLCIHDNQTYLEDKITKYGHTSCHETNVMWLNRSLI